MMRGFTKNNELKTALLTDEGHLVVDVASGSTGDTGGSTSSTSTETTILAAVMTVGTTATEQAVGKTVTSIDVANYSETADVTVTVGETSYVVGYGLALELPINAEVTSLSITSTEDDTRIQLVVKGAE